MARTPEGKYQLLQLKGRRLRVIESSSLNHVTALADRMIRKDR